MKAIGVITVFAGLLALVGTLLPLSQVNDYQVFVTIEHLGAALKLLYVLPLLVLTAGVLTLTRRLDKPRPWLAVAGAVGLLLSSFGAFTAMGHLEMMGLMFRVAEGGTPSMAYGAYALLLAYATVAVVPFTPLYQSNANAL